MSTTVYDKIINHVNVAHHHVLIILELQQAANKNFT